MNIIKSLFITLVTASLLYSCGTSDEDTIIPDQREAITQFLDNNELKTIRSQYEEKEDKVDDALSTSRFKAKGLTGMVKIFQKMTNKSLSYLKY